MLGVYQQFVQAGVPDINLPQNPARKHHRDRLNLDKLSDSELLKKYRLPRQLVTDLCDLLGDDLERPTLKEEALSVQCQVLICLRLLASGSFQNVVGDVGPMSQSSVSRILHVFLNAILRRRELFIYFNFDDQEKIEDNMRKFHAIRGMPGIIGLVDGTMVFMKKPGQNGNVYVGRKRRAAINAQVIVGPNREILDVVARYPGSCHDSWIWQYCGFRTLLYTWHGRGCLLGDCGYPLEEKLITPYRNPNGNQQRNFNKSHKSTRAGVEDSIGMLKSIFRILDQSGGILLYDVETVCKIIVTCCCLYNLRVRNGIQHDEPPVIEDQLDEAEEADYDFDVPDDGDNVIRDRLAATFPDVFWP